jgi:hypothetical protein
MTRRLLPFLAILSLVVAAACAASTQSTSTAAGTSAEELFTANYTNIGNVGATGATPVNIRIQRWTTDDEHQRLMGVLAQKQTEGFVRELREMKQVGSIGAPQELAYPLLYARQTTTKDGGRRITLASDRPMSFEERVGSSVSRDYPLTWIEINVDAKGQGSGTMVLAARLRIVGDVLGIEDLSSQPAKLGDVKKVR